MAIKLMKSTFFEERKTKAALKRFLERAQMLSMGSQVKAFEKAFAEWQGRKHCVMFNSGSSANLALIQALLNLGVIKPRAHVAFSAVTWATNVMPIAQLNLIPVPVDIEIATLNVSAAQLETAYRRQKFSVLFITNLLGLSDDMDAIVRFCKKHKILLLEDNCESLGSEYHGKKLGNFGFGSTFSFFVGHHLSTIEGGAVCTDNEALDHMLRMVRSHGWDRHLPEAEQKRLRGKHRISDFYAKYTFYDLAYNLRPTEIQGFLGLDQLKYIEEMTNRRERNFEVLKKAYVRPDVIPVENRMSRHASFAFPVICKTKRVQEELIARCNKAEIEVRPIVGGMPTRQPFYKKYFGRESDSLLPNAAFIHDYAFYLANNPELTKADLALILKTLAP